VLFCDEIVFTAIFGTGVVDLLDAVIQLELLPGTEAGGAKCCCNALTFLGSGLVACPGRLAGE